MDNAAAIRGVRFVCVCVWCIFAFYNILWAHANERQLSESVFIVGLGDNSITIINRDKSHIDYDAKH